jgi:hypothetical protein
MRIKVWLAVVAALAAAAGVVIARQLWPGAGSRVAAPTPFTYVGTIRDVMHAIVEPGSNALFDSVEVSATPEGVTEKKPQTDEAWQQVELGAIALAEAVNLLKMPGRPVARPEEMTVDPEGPEIAPSEIASLIATSQDRWNRYADALQRHAMDAVKIARARDVKGLYEVGSTIYTACEDCHRVYWYPNDLER